ncbi:hypothetical protein [Rossellomorea marisflavi]|uniref:hypothetical protein n=1 Tax=Rossellomorea marisflavi TaxID=189381 RepID=UPI003F9FB47C
MGSFNTTCMVTGIEIDGRGETLYLPFKMNHDTFKENRKLNYEGKAKSFWEGGETLFTPYLLPITGEYDTYGQLESIVETKNTKAIEEYFGISIESFMEVISCSREFGSTLSSLTEEFLPVDVFSVLRDYSCSFEEELLALGFSLVTSKDGEDKTTQFYKHPKCSFDVILDEDSTSHYLKYTVRHKDGEEQKIQDNFNHDLFEIAIKKDDYFLGVPEEKQDIVRELYGMSGAFIQPEIYELLSTFEADTVKQPNSTKTVHAVYSNVFSDELEGLNLFMRNLVRSNRMLKISKSSSEGNSVVNTEFNLGLMNLIHEESKKL